MYMYFDWWTRQQWNPPIFINIVQEAQRISECHTEEIVTLSGLLKTVLKTLPAHNKTTYMQIHVLFVYMIIHMYSYFYFFYKWWNKFKRTLFYSIQISMYCGFKNWSNVVWHNFQKLEKKSRTKIKQLKFKGYLYQYD